MKKIELTKGKYAIVDDEDYPYLSRFKWVASCISGNYYACIGMTDTTGKTAYKFYMHRFVVNCQKGKEVIFRNKNTLDVRKANLREVTRKQSRWMAQGMIVRGKNRFVYSQYKGVGKNKDGRKKCWIATIMKDGKTQYIGSFYIERNAAAAYNRKAKELYGEFAYQNKI